MTIPVPSTAQPDTGDIQAWLDAVKWPHGLHGVDEDGKTLLMALLEMAGWSPLFRPAMLSNHRLVDLIREALADGVDPNAQNHAGETVIDAAPHLGVFLPMLIEHGLDLHSPKGQQIHGPAMTRILDMLTQNRALPVAIPGLCALIEAGLVPTPGTDWGQRFLQLLNDPIHDHWAGHLREQVRIGVEHHTLDVALPDACKAQRGHRL